MNQLCFLTGLSSSDVAAWAQAVVGATAIIVGAIAVWWQARRARLELCERDASALDGIARLLVHLRDTAIEARAEKKKIDRWPPGHPAEPSVRYREISQAVRAFPLEAVSNEVAFEAVLTARRTSREIEPLVGPEPELDVNQNFETVFKAYMVILEQQINQLRSEAARRLKGERPMRQSTSTGTKVAE
jgi:hypothetical protein